MTVDTRYSGLRVRSRYSRRATIDALGRSGSRPGHQATPPAVTGGTTGSAANVMSSSAGRPTCSMNSASRLGSAISNRLSDAPCATTAARIGAASAVRSSSSSAPFASRRTASTPGRSVAEHRHLRGGQRHLSQDHDLVAAQQQGRHVRDVGRRELVQPLGAQDLGAVAPEGVADGGDDQDRSSRALVRGGGGASSVVNDQL